MLKTTKEEIKVIAFDLDGTLTQHKTPLQEENRRLLDELGRQYSLLMSSTLTSNLMTRRASAMSL